MCHGTPFTYPITSPRLDRLKARHDDEWAQWIRQESPALRRFLKHRLRRRRDVEQDTEEALQSTWLMAFQKVGPHYARPELHRAYLFWLAQAAASEVMRKGGRENPYGGGENGGDEDGDFESSVLDWLASSGIEDERALRQRLEELLDVAQPKLSDSERTFVMLHLFAGQTFAEIAVDLDRPQGTVATTYYRALEKLRSGLLDLAEPPPTERERKVFVMHHAEKLEFDQIAQALQQPLVSVLDDYEEAVAKIWQGLLGLG